MILAIIVGFGIMGALGTNTPAENVNKCQPTKLGDIAKAIKDKYFNILEGENWLISGGYWVVVLLI